ncbi:acyltransferase, partial [Pseudomonas fluorescens]
LSSYSWWLWHGPGFVYACYAAVDGLSELQSEGLMLLSLVLCYRPWRFVDTPFRTKRSLTSRKASLATAMVGSLGLDCTGL